MSRAAAVAPQPGRAYVPPPQSDGDDGYGVVAVVRVGAATVFAVKSSGQCTCRARLLRSSNAGASWRVVTHPPGDPYGASLAFANGERGWMTDPDRHGQLYATRDAARHWSPVPLSGVTTVFAVHDWIYAATATAVYSAPLDGGLFQAVASGTGDVLTSSRNSVFAVPADKTLRSRTIIRIRHRNQDREQSACPAGSETVLARTGKAGLLVVCGGDPSGGSEFKTAYRQRAFASSWHRTTSPTSVGYLNTALSSQRGVFYTGGRSPLFFGGNLGQSWQAVPTPADRTGEGFVGGNFNDPSHGWLLGAKLPNTLYLTNNGGRSWHSALR